MTVYDRIFACPSVSFVKADPSWVPRRLSSFSWLISRQLARCGACRFRLWSDGGWSILSFASKLAWCTSRRALGACVPPCPTLPRHRILPAGRRGGLSPWRMAPFGCLNPTPKWYAPALPPCALQRALCPHPRPPGWTWSLQLRFCRFEGNLLFLLTPMEVSCCGPFAGGLLLSETVGCWSGERFFTATRAGAWYGAISSATGPRSGDRATASPSSLPPSLSFPP
jgi:hypothetical protein